MRTSSIFTFAKLIVPILYLVQLVICFIQVIANLINFLHVKLVKRCCIVLFPVAAIFLAILYN